MKIFLSLLSYILVIGCFETVKYDTGKIKIEALQIANNWTNAWNGEIDLDSIMSLHHEDLQYYWHGKPMNYQVFKEVLKNYVIGIETYNNKIINPVVTVLDKNNVIVSFQLVDNNSNANNDETAFTLVVTRVGPDWKIIHIHEG